MKDGGIRVLVAEVARIAVADAAREDRAQRIADVVRDSGGYRWVGVYTVHTANVAVDAWSGPAAPAYPTFPHDRGLTATAIANGDIVISNDVSIDPRYLTNMDTTGSELIAPVVAEGVVLGTIDIESDRVGAFTDADADLARQIAAAAAPLWRVGR